jgi:transposase-like protein
MGYKKYSDEFKQDVLAMVAEAGVWRNWSVSWTSRQRDHVSCKWQVTKPKDY